ncbi:MAG: DUF1499 domain-containing protein [Proteobacteria bacterium]|nr:DUF1499 domain-containing protein [Pseudomonadota bacterium]
MSSQTRPSRVATLASRLGMAALALSAGSIIGIQVDLLLPATGFYLFGLGAVLGGLLSLVLGLVGFGTSRGGDAIGRRRAWVGTGLGLILVAVVVAAGAPGRGLPSINDITTDLSDPPAFTAALEDPDNQGVDMSYPPEFAELVRAAYPDLQPIVLPGAHARVFQRAIAAAEAQGWEIVWTDPSGEAFEARQTSAVFRFVDDIRVRVRDAGKGAVIDVRSKSRVGRGDLGANAARIRAFAAALQQETAPVASQ